MPITRIYLPLDEAGVRRLAQTGALPSGQVVVAVAPGADEDSEYAAWLRAVDLAAAQAVARDGGALRCVASADVEVSMLTQPPTQTSVVTTASELPLRRIVSFHVDEAPGCPVTDLWWFDVTELPDVLLHLDTRTGTTRP